MECLFCKMIKGEIPCKKIYEDEKVIAILDLYPDSDCHTLIIPKKHITDLSEIDDDTLLHINKVAKKLIPVLMEKAQAEALSTCVNFGTSQAIKHYHMHLLPNFNVKPCTINQEEAYELLKDAF
mgnify:FL=1